MWPASAWTNLPLFPTLAIIFPLLSSSLDPETYQLGIYSLQKDKEGKVWIDMCGPQARARISGRGLLRGLLPADVLAAQPSFFRE